MKWFLIVLLFKYSFGKSVNLFEGDIVLDPITQDIVDGKENEASVFDAMITRKWPGGEIPYIFDARFDSYRRQVVAQAIAEYNSKTCVRFVPRTNQRNYIRFMIGGGCYSMIGRQGGQQDVSIGNGCYYKGTVIHEMMHAAGFFHEQSRRDRDSYITIYWANIMRGMEYNFKKYSHGEADTLNFPYDLDSVMHYEKYAFSSNRRPTILARSNSNRQLGQKIGLSVIDVKQLNAMYGCGAKPTQGPATNTTTTVPSTCTDSHKHCNYWKSVGECQKSPDYMLKNCKKSCNQCGNGRNCKDNHQSCKSWANRGECSNNPSYMYVNCKKSCSRC